MPFIPSAAQINQSPAALPPFSYTAKSTSLFAQLSPHAADIADIGFTQNSMYLHPCWLRAGTLDRLAAKVTTLQASNTFRLGLYNDDGTGNPGTLVVDGGTIDGSSTGDKSVTISTSISEGMYWAAIVEQGGAGGAKCAGLQDNLLAPWYPVASLSAGSSVASHIITGVSGALPDPAGTPTSPGYNWRFFIWARYSS